MQKCKIKLKSIKKIQLKMVLPVIWLDCATLIDTADAKEEFNAVWL